METDLTAAQEAVPAPKYRDRVLRVVRVPAAALKVSPRNWRRHPEPQTKAMEAILARIGFIGAVIVRELVPGDDTQLELIDGHLRKELMAGGDVTAVVTDLSEAEGLEALATFDQVSSLALPDNDRLKSLFADLKAAAVPLVEMGWPQFKIEAVMAEAWDSPPVRMGSPAADPDDVTEPPATPVTKRGDVWLLGPHRLLCGDATRTADVHRLMAGEAADLLLTDPPYGVSYVGDTADEMTIDNDDLDEASLRQFLTLAFASAATVLRPGGCFYLWHAHLVSVPVLLACRDAGLTVRQSLVWVKNHFAFGRQDYHWRHEPCFYGWKDGAAHDWRAGRDQTTVLEFDKPARNGDHPTMKPVALFERLVANSCPAGGRVLDTFAGSGTTLAACHRTGRVARLIEIDPKYCDVIVRRWEGLTGEAAVLEGGGKSADSV